MLHEMFSTSPTCLLPEGMVDAATLDRQMDAFQARTRARIWSADGALSFIPSLPYPLSGIFPLIPSLLSRIPSLPYPLSSVSPLSLIGIFSDLEFIREEEEEGIRGIRG